MDNQQNEQSSHDKREHAKKLFFQTNFTQQQIAQILSVSQKTISIWIAEGKWKAMKHKAQESPLIIIEQMNSELAELNATIAAREPGKRYATPQEAEMRRKTLASVRYVRERQSIGAHIEVLTNFTAFIARRDMQMAQVLSQFADEYIKGQKRQDPKIEFIPYQLPDIDLTAPPGQLPDAA